MVNIRQRKKLRSATPRTKSKRQGLKKSGKKKVNVLGNAIIAENWDRNQTLTQNYRRLGLAHRLNAPAGGNERITTQEGYEDAPEDPLYIKSSAQAEAQKIDLGEAKVERDPETGNIIRVIHDKSKDDEEVEVAGRKHKLSNPLNDPLNEIPDLGANVQGTTQSAKQNAQNAIVAKLEQQAAKEDQAVLTKKPRHQSSREAEWISALISKHGDDYAAMARDRKLNPMQQTPGDIKRRIRKFNGSK